MQCEQRARLANLQPSFGLSPPYLSSAIRNKAPRVSFTRGPYRSGFVTALTYTDSGSASSHRHLQLRRGRHLRTSRSQCPASAPASAAIHGCQADACHAVLPA